MRSPTTIGTDPFWSRMTARVEMGYMAVLPFFGALACYAMDSPFVGWVVMGGWLVAVMNFYIHVPMALSGYKGDRMMLALPLLPTGLLATKQGLAGGGIWDFFLDDMILESGALMLAFPVLFLFGTGIAGDSAWKALGPGMVIVVVGLFVGSIGGYIWTWVLTLPGQEAWEAGAFGLAALFAVWHKVKMIRAMRDGAFNPDTAVEGIEWMIIVLIFSFFILVPVLGNLLF